MESIFSYVSIFSALIPMVIGLRYESWKDKYSNAVFALVVCSFSSDILMIVWAKAFTNNYPIIHLYKIVEIAIVGFLFSKAFNQKLLLAPSILLISAYLFDIFIFDGFHKINSFILGLECFLFILYSLFGYYKIYQTPESPFLENMTTFWYLNAILIYFSVALFSWIMFHFLHQKDGSGIGIWILHNIANILKNILFAVGLWKARAIN